MNDKNKAVALGISGEKVLEVIKKVAAGCLAMSEAFRNTTGMDTEFMPLAIAMMYVADEEHCVKHGMTAEVHQRIFFANVETIKSIRREV